MSENKDIDLWNLYDNISETFDESENIEEIDKKNIDPNVIISDEMPWSKLSNVYERLSPRETNSFTFILNWNK